MHSTFAMLRAGLHEIAWAVKTCCLSWVWTCVQAATSQSMRSNKNRNTYHGCALIRVQYVTSQSITLPAKHKSRNRDTRVQIGMNPSFTMGTTPCPSRAYVPSGPKTKGLEHKSRSWSPDRSWQVWICLDWKSGSPGSLVGFRGWSEPRILTCSIHTSIY